MSILRKLIYLPSLLIIKDELPATRYKHHAVKALIRTVKDHNYSERSLTRATSRIIKAHFDIDHQDQQRASASSSHGASARPLAARHSKNMARRSAPSKPETSSSHTSSSKPGGRQHTSSRKRPNEPSPVGNKKRPSKQPRPASQVVDEHIPDSEVSGQPSPSRRKKVAPRPLSED
ncbi:hypothetical protein M436DRAFT_82714 [Aureobasidium namibiae CBS 147.97]|uniref:Uncharacterized protein n=1 Tax=Aureobasidium namibiae CBS 147.97 TaxID=1043004 RepID=A0A074WHR6_9PEZI|nr:uncharacterized protein M436DRAFT_82714 [Aureobasidium namibiae CBS 147.97]KEQ72615.1 hypothetical protein M436DRAFT_82714 [Aureobasidium namibiae CBS 147.97]